MPIVYKHTNRVNGKAYVGWTTLTIEERWERHLVNASCGIKTLFYNAIRKHGPDVWDHQVIGEFDDDLSAKEAEIASIAKHTTYAFDHPDRGYNMTRGGDGVTGEVVVRSNKQRQVTTETRAKMGLSGRTRQTSEVTRARLSSASKGRKFSVEHGKNHKLSQEKRSRRTSNLRLVLEDQRVLLCGGPDRCGKTNILKELERRTGIPYFKATTERSNFVSSQERFINELRYADPRVADILYQTGWSMLIDRGYMCEWVYARFFDRPTDMKALRVMDNEYKKIGAKILICTRKSFAGIQDDLDPRIDEQALTRISGLYEEFSRWTKCKTHTLFVDDEDLEREVNEVLTYLEVQ